MRSSPRAVPAVGRKRLRTQGIHKGSKAFSRPGKALEKRFGGTPYGWERDMLRLILATLFRAGEIEVTHQGNLFRTYQDPASRTPFTNNPAFRAALFSPRQSVGLKTLTYASWQAWLNAEVAK